MHATGLGAEVSCLGKQRPNGLVRKVGVVTHDADGTPGTGRRHRGTARLRSLNLLRCVPVCGSGDMTCRLDESLSFSFAIPTGRHHASRKRDVTFGAPEGSTDRSTNATGWQSDSKSIVPGCVPSPTGCWALTSEAEDAVQEAWIRLSRSNEGAIDNLEAWLVTVVGHVALEHAPLTQDTFARSYSMHTCRTRSSTVPTASRPNTRRCSPDSVGLALLVVLES